MMSKGIKKEIKEFLVSAVVGLVLALGIGMVVQLTVVSGESMYPNLDNKDYLLINKLPYDGDKVSRGDIIVFDSKVSDDSKKGSTKSYIKRVVGLPGERVEIVNGYVYIDGDKLEEPYLDGVFTDGEVDVVVPDGELYVLGDNRPNSGDSRLDYIGTVSFEDVIGEAIFRLYPFKSIGKLD